ncbi:MAG: oligoendopeptidase F [Chlamydiia bacterium]|nr:oligoendopeptidase F [Chlamydiia bacterium]
MVKARKEVPISDTWNVEALYPNEQAWKQDFEMLKGVGMPHWPQLNAFQGNLHEPEKVASLLESYFTIDRKLAKLHTYAYLRMDEDLGNDATKTNHGLISSLIYEFQHECAWIEPELLALKENDFQHLLKAPALHSYRFYLEKIGRMRPHTLPKEMEELLALSGKALDASSRSFSALNNADLTFAPAVDSQGKEHPLTHASYLSYLRNPDRQLRKSAFQNLHQGFKNHINTLCELLQGQVQSHLFLAKARKFSNCLEGALFPHQIETAVYENLIASVRRYLPLMHRYIALRKQGLHVEELHAYDLHIPLVSEIEIKMPYLEACEAVVASVARLGNEYQELLKKGLLQDRWVDIYENARKRSGAYSGGCYDSMPYILLNYQGNLSDIFTLAHEAGHSMHRLLGDRHQSYIYAAHPIFVAEVASTFNEQLLLDYLKAQRTSKKERAFLINHEIEQIRNTIFRQTLFAEFELAIHKLAEEGIPLTPALLKEKYLGLYRDYYGSELVLDEEVAVEWARVPHFYYNFYVYQYATGLSAALALHEKALQSTENVKKYIEFLSAGGSRYPIELLERAGVNMRSSDPQSSPVDAAMRHFSSLVNELEKQIL